MQLSDRSVIRLDERTTIELLPPRRNESRRFGLPEGALYFFNREKPSNVEFDTPIAAGAIRGTEFLLAIRDAGSRLRLALLDGLVDLQTPEGTNVSVSRGEDLVLTSGQAPLKTVLVNANHAIQWALYYPAVLNPDELDLDPAEQRELTSVLTAYRAGDLLQALQAWPREAAFRSPGARSLRAQLILAVGGVNEAESLLEDLPQDFAPRKALAELIHVVRGDPTESLPLAALTRSSSELLAQTYALQRDGELRAAREAAEKAAQIAPQSGFAQNRLAELEFAFEYRERALAALDRALTCAPRLPPAQALRGFVMLERDDVRAALEAFDSARQLDAGYGPAWLGRGLCLLRQRRFPEAREAFQAAAALEPQRALFRAYLGKAAAELGDSKAAEKEFNLAKRLDPQDPTGWLYSALQLWQENRVNESIRDLEQAQDVNDSRAPFRSQLLLDRDRSVASANLAAIYADAGLSEVSRHAAARAVIEDYANFSGHLFLANALQAQEDANRFDLRLESARQSELLAANLLAPPGAGNLSQLLSQQEHLRFFDPRPIGLSTRTDYASDGSWVQEGTVFGTLGGLSYAFDSQYQSRRGLDPNGAVEWQQYALTLKQRVTTDDEFYFQAGYLKSESGDVAAHFDSSGAIRGFKARESQEPGLYAGWHHTWSPGSHTLFLFGRLDDRLAYTNPLPNVLYLHQGLGGWDLQTDGFLPPFRLAFDTRFTLYSAELQHIWETERQSLVVGARGQWADTKVHSRLAQDPIGPGFEVFSEDQNIDRTFSRAGAYAYYSIELLPPLRLIGGLSYDHIEYPENTDLPPVSGRLVSKDAVSPKAGLLWTPWNRGLFRAEYTKSLGGLLFDNSVRLEPAQMAGFNQAFRSLIPESVAGLAPGARFETAGAAFDQSLPGGTWFGVGVEQLTSDADRTVGMVSNSVFFGGPDSTAGTRQALDFRERNLSAYAGHLLGDWLALSAHYRLSEARLTGRFPELPDTASGLAALEQNNRATLQSLSLDATLNHPSGFFGQWDSTWYHQGNTGYDPARADADFWQHNVYAGWRFSRRSAEFRVGVLNLLDQNYQLNPLNLHGELPRDRTFVLSLRLNF